jgi:hypothetical protein
MHEDVHVKYKSTMQAREADAHCHCHCPCHQIFNTRDEGIICVIKRLSSVVNTAAAYGAIHHTQQTMNVFPS